MRIRATAVVVLLALSVVGCGRSGETVVSGDATLRETNGVSPTARPTPPEFGHATAILDNGPKSVLIDVDVADRPEQRAYGLMNRTSLPPDYGMVFLFFEDVHSPFHMKDTHVPLSIAFFDAGGTIREILDMTPCTSDSCPVYMPRKPYRGALEVPRGAFEQWDISVGDSIRLAR